MTELLRRDAPITATDTAARTLTVQLLAWDEPRLVADPDRPPYRERWARDSLLPLERLYVVDRHGGELIGRMEPPTDAGPGPQTRVHIAHTRAGDDLLALVDAGVIDAVSIEALPAAGGEVWNDDHTEVTRTRGHLAGLAFAFHPAHDAPILERTGEPTMTDTAIDVPDPAPVEPVPEPAGDTVMAELAALRGQVTELVRARPAGTGPARFATLGELMRAAALDPGNGAGRLPRDRMGGGVVILERAWTDLTTTDIPGLLPPQQIREIWDVIAPMQPFAEAAGSAPAPTSLTYSYPHITQRPLVAVQAAQKTEIASRDLQVAMSTAPVQTLAGGNDVSIQAIQLTDPPVLQLLGQLYAEEMARATDAAAYAAYDTAATVNVSIGAVASGWNQALFNLVSQIYTATRRWPDRMILSPDLWAKLGGAADADGRPLFTAVSPFNPVGTASLASPEGDFRQLRFTVSPSMPTDRGALFASSAFRAGLGPVQTMSVDVPRLLGRDIAFFRFGAFLAIDPAAMALFATGVAPTATEGGEPRKATATKK